MRVHMTMCNFTDAELLDDPVKGKHLTSRERYYAEYLRKVPSFFDWFNYNMFTPFAFIGESIEYGTFDDFINYRGDIAKMRPHSNIFPAVRRQIESIICFSVFYSLSFIAEPLDMLKPEFLARPYWFKLVFMVLAANCKIFLLFSRFVYHEAGLIATGISFRARGEKTFEEYNSIRCMDILNFTWSPTAKESIANWNMRTQHFLKYYIMLRQMDRNKSKGSFQLMPLIFTFGTSTFFHGLYPGYSFFFVGLFVLDIAWKFYNESMMAAWWRGIVPEKIFTIGNIAVV